MPNRKLKDVLLRIGLKQAELARLIGVSQRTVSQWATGDADLPGPVAAYLRVLQKLAPEALAEELGRLEGRKLMLDEGLYGLDYWTAGAAATASDAGAGLAVLRNGKIRGSGRWGGIFDGSYVYDPVKRANTVHVRLQVPPRGELVTGFAAGPKGAMVDIVGSFDRAAPVAQTVVSIDGQPVAVKLAYLGALPK